ncbi:MAG: AI-2E family transporter [Gammaproteobacteria bacterium]
MKPAQVFALAAAVLAVPVFVVYAGAALTPFILAAVLAYMLAPLAAKMEKRRLPPAAAAALCVIVILAALVALPLAVVPLVAEQINKLAVFLPSAAANAAKWLGGAHPQLLAQLKMLAPADVAGLVDGGQALQTANFAAGVFGKGLSAALSFLAALVLTPLVAFYFIRDRNAIGGEITAALPPARRPAIVGIAADLDRVLGEFLRGQLLVMAIMAVLYSLVLHFTGVPFALAIGVIAGILVFVPYVGFMAGLFLATISGLGHFSAWGDFAVLWLAMTIGTTLESMFITPYFVGERVGLHPVAVLAAVLIFGELFGFVGVLISLPLAAALLVVFRHLRRRYMRSDFYAAE